MAFFFFSLKFIKRQKSNSNNRKDKRPKQQIKLYINDFGPPAQKRKSVEEASRLYPPRGQLPFNLNPRVKTGYDFLPPVPNRRCDGTPPSAEANRRKNLVKPSNLQIDQVAHRIYASKDNLHRSILQPLIFLHKISHLYR